MKKILIATGLYPPESGGPATYTKTLEDKLPAYGFELVVLPYKEVRHLPRGIRHLAYFFRCWSLARKADLVYAQDTFSVGLPAVLAAILARRTFLVRVPGDYAWEQARQRFGVKDELEDFQNRRYGVRVGILRAAQCFVVRRAKAVVVPSEYMKRIVGGWLVLSRVEGLALSRIEAINAGKIFVIYSSIELPVQYELPNNRPDGFLVVTVARLVPWKGIDTLLDAVRQEPNWSLAVVGDGPERARLEGLATATTLFTGELPHEQAMGWIQAADVFALTSTYEGLSHVLIEALSLGKPVVATVAGGNPEVIEDGVNGLLTPPHDVVSLHSMLGRIDADRDLAQKLGAEGAQRAQSFSIENSITKIADLLNAL